MSGYQSEQQRQQLLQRNKLVVRVVEARALKAADFGGTSDPFVELRIKNQIDVHKTKVIKKTLNPFWNEEFVLYPTNPDYDFLSVKVYDYDAVSNNDLLGELELPVGAIVAKRNEERWIQLGTRKGATLYPARGEIKLNLQWVTPGAPILPSAPPSAPPSTPAYNPQAFPQQQAPPTQYPQQYSQQYPSAYPSTQPPAQYYPPQPQPSPYPVPQSSPYPDPYATQYPSLNQLPPQYPPQQYAPQYPPQQYAPQYPPQPYPQPQYPSAYPTPSPFGTVGQTTFVTIPQFITRQTYSYSGGYNPHAPFVIPYGVPPHLHAKMLQASAIFRMFDRDRSGYLSKKEWKHAMRHLGYYMSKHDAKALFYMVDTDRSGRISEREFCEYWIHHGI